MNTYGYVLQNPINGIDPDGLSLRSKIAEWIFVAVQAFSDGDLNNTALKGKKLPKPEHNTEQVDKRKKGKNKKYGIIPDPIEIQQRMCETYGAGCLPWQTPPPDLPPSCI